MAAGNFHNGLGKMQVIRLCGNFARVPAWFFIDLVYLKERANRMDLAEIWSGGLIQTVISLGAVGLAIGVSLIVWQRRLSEQRAAEQLRYKLAEAEGNLYWSQSILAVSPSIVLVWEPDHLAPQQEEINLDENLDDEVDLSAYRPLGKPQMLGSAKALSAILGIGGPDRTSADKAGTNGLKEEYSIFDFFLNGLHRHDKSRLVAAIQDLKTQGENFSLEVESPEGKAFDFEGRTAGGKAVVWVRDVTDEGDEVRKLSHLLEEAERERNTFVELLDAAPFPVWRRDGEMKIAWVNRAYTRAVEESDVETVVSKGSELDHAGQSLARQAAESIDMVTDRRYVVVDGQRRAMDFVEMPLAAGTVGVALDATNVEEAENVLKQHIEAHSKTLDTLATAVAIFGPDKRLVFYNHACQELWHLNDKWLEEGPTEGEILEKLREERKLPEQADFPAWKRQRLDLYANLIDMQDEMWPLPDGRTLRVIVQPHPFGGLIYLYEDVTDLVTLESSYNRLINVQRATLDNLHEGVAVFGSDGRLKLHNDSFEHIWNVSADRLEGEPHFESVSEFCSDLLEDNQGLEELRGQITSGGGTREAIDGRMERIDGKVIDFTSIPLPDGATIAGFLDVTASIEVERALRERNEALETADKLKSEFVNHVSYQLRTPLNSIVGFAEILDQKMFGELTEKQAEYTTGIIEASSQLMNLINDILDLATIEAGGMALELGEVNLRDVIDSTIAINQKKALDNSLTLKIDCAPNLAPIYADERRIKQILYNLLTNAMAFTEGGGTIKVGAEKTGNQIAIWVEDNGSGIDPEYQARVFDRFENRGGEGKKGAGLGLSLVKSFVELHGGWVALESEPGIGTKVICYLADQSQQEAAE